MFDYLMTNSDNGKGVDVARAATKSPSGYAFFYLLDIKYWKRLVIDYFFLIFIEKVVTLYF
jgi:hypothetical protein